MIYNIHNFYVASNTMLKLKLYYLHLLQRSRFIYIHVYSHMYGETIFQGRFASICQEY